MKESSGLLRRGEKGNRAIGKGPREESGAMVTVGRMPEGVQNKMCHAPFKLYVYTYVVFITCKYTYTHVKYMCITYNFEIYSIKIYDVQIE